MAYTLPRLGKKVTTFAYRTNYLVDLANAVIVDVEATAAIRQTEVGAVRNMLVRTNERFDLHPERPTADTAYGSAEMRSLAGQRTED